MKFIYLSQKGSGTWGSLIVFEGLELVNPIIFIWSYVGTKERSW